MRNVFVIVSLAVLAACNSSTSNDIELAKKSVLDSVNNAAELQAIKQKTIDSMNQVNTAQHHAVNAAVTASHEEVTKKKKMSNTTKGALIGTGAGVITGAVAGALLDKDDPAKGAAIGGVIGGAVGSGAGYGVGASKDKKAKTKATSKE
ncbi:MAG: YMGG-like glycine zipper-containing protein [Bacteroidota bacterium]